MWFLNCEQVFKNMLPCKDAETNKTLSLGSLEKPYNFRHLSSIWTACGKHISHSSIQKTQASKPRWSESQHCLMPSNITTIKSTVLFRFLIDRFSTVNGIIFFHDLSTGSYLEAFQNLFLYYSETDLNLLNKNCFLQMLFSGFFFPSILLFCSFPPLPR